MYWLEDMNKFKSWVFTGFCCRRRRKIKRSLCNELISITGPSTYPMKECMGFATTLFTVTLNKVFGRIRPIAQNNRKMQAYPIVTKETIGSKTHEAGGNGCFWGKASGLTGKSTHAQFNFKKSIRIYLYLGMRTPSQQVTVCMVP